MSPAIQKILYIYFLNFGQTSLWAALRRKKERINDRENNKAHIRNKNYQNSFNFHESQSKLLKVIDVFSSIIADSNDVLLFSGIQLITPLFLCSKFPVYGYKSGHHFPYLSQRLVMVLLYPIVSFRFSLSFSSTTKVHYISGYFLSFIFIVCKVLLP